MIEAEFRSYRRNLPHFRMRGATYFVTWHLHASQDELAGPERSEVLKSLLHFHGRRYDLSAFVVMNDHVHTLVAPFDGWTLDDVVQGWKSFTAHQLTKRHVRLAPVWTSESLDRIVRDQAEFDEKMQYILNNPVKRWPTQVEYPWVGCLSEVHRESEVPFAARRPDPR